MEDKKMEKENETLKIIVLKDATGAYSLLGAAFCCLDMQQRFEIDVDTGMSVPGKPCFNLIWRFRGIPISVCPFCGKTIEFEVHEESNLAIPNPKAVSKIMEPN